jgi:hypothetical protein
LASLSPKYEIAIKERHVPALLLVAKRRYEPCDLPIGKRSGACHRRGWQALDPTVAESAKPYLKVGTLQASHTSATSDGTKAVRYPSIRKFIAPISISGFGDSLPKTAMTCFQGSFRRALFFLENSQNRRQSRGPHAFGAFIAFAIAATLAGAYFCLVEIAYTPTIRVHGSPAEPKII